MRLRAPSAHLGATEQVEADEFHAQNLNFRFDLDLKSDRRLLGTFTVMKSETNGFPDNGGGPRYSLSREFGTRDLRRLTSSLEYGQRLRPWWNLRARLSLFDGHQQLLIPTMAPALQSAETILPLPAETTRQASDSPTCLHHSAYD